MLNNTKYVFVTGGVISGLGKGIITASTGLILQNLGFKISVLKADMYLNLDAGTMNPLEHGEVFVTEDAYETDQDLGHYERFLNKNVYKHNYITMGKIYYDVITKERELGYKGKSVEGNVHIPEEIISKIKFTAKKDGAEIILIEVGGTVGEYQNIMFYEAIRKLKQKEPENVLIVHLVYLPIPKFLGEMKSKPAQTSIYELYKLGLQPSFVICRSETSVDLKRKNTISTNTGVKPEHIISAPDIDTIYKIPNVLKNQNYDKLLLKELKIKSKTKHNSEWDNFIKKLEKTKNNNKTVKIGICGKYFTSGDFSLTDSYVCVLEAIKHACWLINVNPVINWIDVENFENTKKFETAMKNLKTNDAIIIPQGWGSRGVEGKIKVVEYVRNNKIPFLGLCFGMQMSVVEFTRNVLGLNDANTIESDENTKHKVIVLMENQKENINNNKFGGTIRLGAWPCVLKKGTLISECYNKYGNDRIEKDNLGNQIVYERHRHRYEFNNDYRDQLEKAGLVVSGTSVDGKLVESIEINKKDHPFFIGTQFHPEYKSRPLSPHPIFIGFVKSVLK